MHSPEEGHHLDVVGPRCVQRVHDRVDARATADADYIPVSQTIEEVAGSRPAKGVFKGARILRYLGNHHHAVKAKNGL